MKRTHHDRTLLAKLGFGDGDRLHPLHDLACQYLGDGSVANQVLDHLTPPARRMKLKSDESFSYTHWTEVPISSPTHARPDDFKAPSLRHPLRIVGFADCLLSLCLTSTIVFRALIEVKAQRCDLGSALRQLETYRAHIAQWPERDERDPLARMWGTDYRSSRIDAFVLATCYPLTRREGDILAKHSVVHIVLSPALVRAWGKRQDAQAYAPPTF